MATVDQELARLPEDVRRRIFRFLRHPAAELVSNLRFRRAYDWLCAYESLSVYGDDLPAKWGCIEKMHFRHNLWSGEAVDCQGRLRRHATGRIHCYPDGRVSSWGFTPHPPPSRAPGGLHDEIPRLGVGEVLRGGE